MKEYDSNYKLPEIYKDACFNPQVKVLGCHHLRNINLCPGTCNLAMQGHAQPTNQLVNLVEEAQAVGLD